MKRRGEGREYMQPTPDPNCDEIFDKFADRIEAAWKREKEVTK